MLLSTALHQLYNINVQFLEHDTFGRVNDRDDRRRMGRKKVKCRKKNMEFYQQWN